MAYANRGYSTKYWEETVEALTTLRHVTWVDEDLAWNTTAEVKIDFQTISPVA